MPPASGAASGRLPVVDMFRGLGIALMIAYHFSWDLSFFGFAEVALFSNPWWLAFRTLIVSMFLGASGFSHALARRRPLDPAHYRRRTLTIAGAAALVSLATWFVFPSGFIYFGVLHNLAVASLLILPFARLPAAQVGAIGVLVMAMPKLIAFTYLDPIWLAWIGLAPAPPFSVDYVPVFPWFGVTLIGFALGRWAAANAGALSLLARAPGDPLSALLKWTGRHTLVIYLVHQPILFGATWLAAKLAGAV